MAGYSSTPLIKKLGIKPDAKVIFINEPSSFKNDLGPLPDGATLLRSDDRPSISDYIHFFTKSREELENFFPQGSRYPQERWDLVDKLAKKIIKS